MRRTLNPFPSNVEGKPRTSFGGAKPGLQIAADALADSGAPQLSARIYTPGALTDGNDDPRYPSKPDNVENIYHPAAEKPAPRSGIAQAINWLMTGKME